MDIEEATQPSSQHLAPVPAANSDEDEDIACILACTTAKPGGHYVLRKEGGTKHQWRFGRSHTVDCHLIDSKRISNCHFVIWMVSWTWRSCQEMC
jgi:hypothetical protein